ncbi:MAG: hypothetical protein Q9204_006634 [Flavoplaca sp. TL-2023a]
MLNIFLLKVLSLMLTKRPQIKEFNVERSQITLVTVREYLRVGKGASNSKVRHDEMVELAKVQQLQWKRSQGTGQQDTMILTSVRNQIRKLPTQEREEFIPKTCM